MNIKSLLPFVGRKAAKDAKLAEVNELRKQLCTPTVDPKLLRPELLAARDERGRTIVHESTVAGGLRHIPHALLTKQLIDIKDMNGDSVLHMAARGGYLHQIPDRFLEVRDLLAKNNKGESPLKLAAQEDCGLDEIPQLRDGPRAHNLRSDECIEIAHALSDTGVKNQAVQSAIETFGGAPPEIS